MNGRIKQIRIEKGLTQVEFAKRLKVSRNNIAGYEAGTRTPSEAVISLICKEFSVSEVWLRTGEGLMFQEANLEAEMLSFIKIASTDKDATFKRRFISVLSRLSEDQWVFLEQKMREILEEGDPMDEVVNNAAESVSAVPVAEDQASGTATNMPAMSVQVSNAGEQKPAASNDPIIDRKVDDYRAKLELEASNKKSSALSAG